jgi:hypothetical protein
VKVGQRKGEGRVKGWERRREGVEREVEWSVMRWVREGEGRGKGGEREGKGRGKGGEREGKGRGKGG